jgi:hypothetical protein
MATLEQELINALEAGARQSADPDSAFFTNVARGIRRRLLRRRAAVAASVAVLTILVGGSVPQLVGKHAEPLPPSSPPDLSATYPTTVPDFDNAPKVTDVWRDAVRTLPETLPGGSRYFVQAVLPHNQYLVLEPKDSPPGYRLERPGIFDPAAGTVRELAPADASTTIIGAGIIGSDAVWATEPLHFKDTGTAYELWTAPLAGGAARKLITLERDASSYIQSFTIAGRFVMWDRHESYQQPNGMLARRSLGIYRLALSGGAPQLVAGTQGYQLQKDYSGWGGASAVAIRNANMALGPAGWTSDDPAGAPLIDLMTGARVPWSPAPEVNTGPTGRMVCGLLGCTSLGPTAFTQRRDGSGYLEIGDKNVGPVGDGRFLRLEYDAPTKPGVPWPGRRLVVWDRKSARAVLCGMLVADGVVRPDLLERNRPFVTWIEGSKMMLLDITKIK